MPLQTTTIVVLLAALAIGIIVALLIRRPPRIALLEGSSLDYISDGTSALSLFTANGQDGAGNLLYPYNYKGRLRTAHITPETVDATAEQLYKQGVRIYVGMLETAMLLPMLAFARRHSNVVILSAASTLPRANLIPPNVFRLGMTSAAFVRALHGVIKDRFTGITRVLAVNGTPSNEWATTIKNLAPLLTTFDYTVADTMTTTEAAGTPRSDTVYIYAGNKADFHLHTHFSAGANILVAEATGWKFTIDAGTNDPLANHHVFSVDAINGGKVFQIATMRTGKPAPLMGHLLHALRIALVVDRQVSVSTKLMSTIAQQYGPHSQLVFTEAHDGNIEGLFTARLLSVESDCTNCLFSEIGSFIGGAAETAGNAFNDTVNYMQDVVLEADTVRCGEQVASCANALQGGDVRAVCGPLLHPLDGDSPCLQAVNSQAGDCMDYLGDCVNNNNQCAAAAGVCTTAVLTHSAATFLDRIIPADVLQHFKPVQWFD